MIKEGKKMIRCDICDRYLDTKDCKLREIAPKLTGCDGYGILSRTLVEKKEKEREIAIKKQEIQAKKNLAKQFTKRIKADIISTSV